MKKHVKHIKLDKADLSGDLKNLQTRLKNLQKHPDDQVLVGEVVIFNEAMIDKLATTSP